MSQKSSTTQTDDLPEVVVTRHHRFSLIWVVPVIALLVSGWLIYRAYAERGTDITITFKDGSGLVAGKTQLQHLGVQVGMVNEVNLNDKFSEVIIKARLQKSASGLASKGSQFWVVRPEIGLGGVRGLDTILSGPYISISPGDGQTPQKSFTGLEEAPISGPREPGLNLILQAEQLGSIKYGDAVYYREFQVGTVDQVKMASDARSIHAHVHIKEDYEHLVRENTHFWNASGIGMKLGLFGAKIQTESLASILSGGIAFATPPNDEMGGPVSDGTIFKLYDDPKDDWTKWSPTLTVTDSEVPVAQKAADPGPESANASTPSAGSQETVGPTVEDPAGTNKVKDHSTPKKLPSGPHGHH